MGSQLLAAPKTYLPTFSSPQFNMQVTSKRVAEIWEAEAFDPGDIWNRNRWCGAVWNEH
jgi:hypothetical protein